VIQDLETSLASEFRALKRKPNDLNSEDEAAHVVQILQAEGLADLFADYDDVHAIGAGGSNVILDAHFIPHNTRRAIKLPRLKITAPQASEKPLPVLDPELHALSKVSHKNITRLFESRPLHEKRGYCMITELVPEHLPLDLYAISKCGSEACKRDPGLRERALISFAAQLFAIVDALVHMHEDAQLIHFDLKPDNILVSNEERAFVTDLGFARDLSKYGPDDPVEVGFTYKYSHWRLHDVNQGARITTVPEKSKNTLWGRELHPRFDIFAFGRTLQEVLKELENVYGRSVYSDYTFTYLHIIASLCLDGLNSAAAHTNTFVSDHALEMPLSLFSAHKFTSFREVRIAFERLLGYRDIRMEVPELDEWAGGTINVSDMGITTLTPRVKALLEHPLVYRLTDQRQLGLLETVFPTATHTRFQHSLGVYHAVTRYILALYHDPDNPTFKILFSAQDCLAALATTIVHDIGHTAYGHDLEEVDEDEFSHAVIGRAILDQSQVRDKDGRLVTDILMGSDSDCWNLDEDKVYAFLDGEPLVPIHNLYHDILDGQLDADKLDYLLRDSVETRVKYGQGIDHQRFLRSLTTTAEEENKVAAIRLAIKQKGAASAEAFAFGRYQMYQALYWHHTFRAIKAMLLTAAARTVSELRKHPPSTLFEQTPLRNAYISYVIEGIQPTYNSAKNTKTKRTEDPSQEVVEPIDLEIARRLTAKPTSPIKMAGSRDRALEFLWCLARGKEMLLIEDLGSFTYYKRVLELPLADFVNPTAISNALTHKRVEFHTRLEAALIGALKRAIQDQIVVRESLVEDDLLERLQAIADKKHVFVADLPLRGWIPKGEPPSFVSDYKRRHFRSDVGAHRFDGDTLWTRQIREMMTRVAFFRIFCEPEVHSILKRVMDVGDVLTAFKKEFKELEVHTKSG